jgi:hypothetical protein
MRAWLTYLTSTIKALVNSKFAIDWAKCSKDSFVVNQTLVFQIKFCGKNHALRVAAKRYILQTNV